MTTPGTAPKQDWLLYGANGYTGELIAEEAKRRGLQPVLAGRREATVRPLAEKLGLPWRAFALDDPTVIARELRPFQAVLLCAGPFSATSAQVVEACLQSGTHYLDITGEIGVFEACFARSAEAVASGVVLMPGVGFDVVPSDCLAAALAEKLPDAKTLELAFAGEAGFSRGTAKTMIEGMPLGCAVRENGKIRDVPLAFRTADIPFRDRTRHAVSIRWGDVSTAWWSTHIPNITVYMAARRSAVRWMKLARPLVPLLGLGPVQRLLKARVDKVQGPDEKSRETARMHLWGRVTNAAGKTVEATLETPEGYALTVQAALVCTERVVAGEVAPGCKTPSMAFGVGLVTGLAGCDLRFS